MTAMTAKRLSHRSFIYHHCISIVSVVGIVLLPSVKAQQVELPAGSDADHKKLMRIRAEAQVAQRDAQIAALRRTATQSTDQNNRDSVLERSRRDKEFKRRAALAVQQQQAINAYEKVKQSEIDSWNGKGQKVSRGVPADFTANLPPLEENPKKRGGLFRGVAAAPGIAIKGLSSLRPGFLGGKKNRDNAPVEPSQQFAPPERLGLDSVAPSIPEPTMPAENVPVEQSRKSGFKLPLISKLTGGKNKDADLYAAEENMPDSSQQQQALEAVESNSADSPPEEKKGFFKGIASRIPIVGNKKEGSGDNPYYYENTDEEGEMESDAKSGFFSKISLKKNKGNNDENISEANNESSGGSRKNIYVVESGKAQFFPFGEGGRQADAQPLGEGTIVRMTKSGDDWSSIELSSGSMGVIRNKHLRRAKSGEIPSNLFVNKPKIPYPTTARISKTRSAIGKGKAHRYREPVSVPLPDLPASGAGSDAPIGNGLLPPLEESAIQ